jgi:hypothetical protein
MTHDELLAKINYELEAAEFEDRCGDGGHPPTHKALRAVVELCNFLDKKGHCCVPIKEIIQAIEKELQ